MAMFTVRTATTLFLRTGFTGALRQLGLQDDLGITSLAREEERESLTRHLEATINAGVTAIFVHIDRIAIEISGLALEMGLELPRDLSIVTYDDQLAELAPTPLTSVSPPTREVGQLAVTMVFEQITRAGNVQTARHVTLRPQLVHRESTAPPGQSALIHDV